MLISFLIPKESVGSFVKPKLESIFFDFLQCTLSVMILMKCNCQAHLQQFHERR